MKKPTQKQIDTEIAKLEELLPKIRPFDIFGGDNRKLLQIQIDVLKGEVDRTAAEYDELSPDEYSNAEEAFSWLEGRADARPSDGWKSLVRGKA